MRTLSISRIVVVVIAVAGFVACAVGAPPSTFDAGQSQLIAALPPSSISRDELGVRQWLVYRYRTGVSIVAVGAEGRVLRNLRYHTVTTGHSGTAVAVESTFPQRAHGLILSTGEIPENTFVDKPEALTTLLAADHDTGEYLSSGIVPYDGCGAALGSALAGCGSFLSRARTALTWCAPIAVTGASAGLACIGTVGAGCPPALAAFATVGGTLAVPCGVAGLDAYMRYGTCADSASRAWDSCTRSDAGTSGDDAGTSSDDAGDTSADAGTDDPDAGTDDPDAGVDDTDAGDTTDPTAEDAGDSTDPTTGDDAGTGGSCFESTGDACCESGTCDSTSSDTTSSDTTSSDTSSSDTSSTDTSSSGTTGSDYGDESFDYADV